MRIWWTSTKWKRAGREVLDTLRMSTVANERTLRDEEVYEIHASLVRVLE